MLNGGYDLRTGNEAIARGDADLIAFGVPFLANPDLPERFRQSAPLNEADRRHSTGAGRKAIRTTRAFCSIDDAPHFEAPRDVMKSGQA